MANIEKVTQGALAKNKKLNEIIERLNSLLNIQVNQVDTYEPPEIEYSDNNVVLRIPSTEAAIQDLIGADLSEYSPQQINLCINNQAKTGTILIKDLS